MVTDTRERARLEFMLFKDMDETKLESLLQTAKELTYGPGEVCQKEGEIPQRIEIIKKGKIGVEVDLFCSGNKNRSILDTFGPGEAYGLSALIRYPSMSTLRVLEPLNVLCFDASGLLNLCKNDEHIGYIVMKNMAAITASRMRRSRMVTLRAITGIKAINL